MGFVGRRNGVKPLVLVADDDRLDRFILRRFLEGEGYAVTEAVDGMEALTVYASRKPDVVLLDAIMPGLDGISVCTRLRDLSGEEGTPVLMITALDDDKSVELAFNAGAYDYITKPVHWAVLRQRLHRLLSVKAAQRARRESESRYRILFEDSKDSIYIRDKDGKMIDVNQSMLDLFGYKKSEILLINMSKLYANREDLERFEQETTQKGFVREYELKMRKKDGSLIDCLISSTLWGAGDGNFLGYQGIIRDITERKRASEELRRVNRALRVISEFNQNMIRINKEEDLLREICRVVVEFGEYPMVWVGLTGQNSDQPFCKVIRFSRGEKFINWPEAEKGAILSGVAMQTGEISLVKNAQTASFSSSWPGHAKGRAFLSIISIPLIAKKQVLGALNIYAEGMEVFDGEEIRLLKELAGDFVYGLVHLQTRAERERAEEDLRKESDFIEAVLETAGFLVFVLDRNGRIVRFNRACEQKTGYSLEQVKNLYMWDIFLTPEEIKKVKSNFKGIKQGHYPNESEDLWITSDGRRRLIAWSNTALLDSEGEVEYIISTGIDITERRHMEEQLKYNSLHDSLTGLYNRTYFEEEMRRLDGGRHTSAGIIICDIDGLKIINDTLGHDKGDALLIQSAKILRRSFCDGDVVARIGGDEFAVLLPGADSANVESACRRIRDTIEEHNAANQDLPLSISIGFATGGWANEDMASLFKEADNNMYREKLHRRKSARSAIVRTLMKALEARDFITEGHARRLEDLVISLGIELGLPESNLADLRLLAQFHDIGKVGVQDRILFKPGTLTPEEMKEMQRHCEIGQRIAQSAPDLLPITDWLLKHHEWWNGKGYPLGIKGEEIPLECRILAIADAYDAMTNNRPYRKAITSEEAIKELEKCSGTQFDAGLVEKFIRVLKEKGSSAKKADSAGP